MAPTAVVATAAAIRRMMVHFMLVGCCASVLFGSSSFAWTTITTPATTASPPSGVSASAGVPVAFTAAINNDNNNSRRRVLERVSTAVVGAAALAVSGTAPARAAAGTTTTTLLPNGVEYTVIKSGNNKNADDAVKPVIGELVAIRFAAMTADGTIRIDDIFDSPEPYYTRVGSGGLIPGVEQTLPLMQLGDRWKLIIPGRLAFGSKGRPASAGKPRIPADATIVFEVEMVGIPGREPELIELIGDF